MPPHAAIPLVSTLHAFVHTFSSTEDTGCPSRVISPTTPTNFCLAVALLLHFFTNSAQWPFALLHIYKKLMNWSGIPYHPPPKGCAMLAAAHASEPLQKDNVALMVHHTTCPHQVALYTSSGLMSRLLAAPIWATWPSPCRGKRRES